MPTLKINGLQFALLGDFNPTIFQPAWLVSEKLISDSEVPDPKQLFISSEVVNFTLPWASFNITPQYFSALTTQESHFEPLRDLVVGTFKLLKHTPVQKLGINVEQHYFYEDLDEWNNFGHKLAPKAIWKKFMDDPGLVSIRVTDKTPRKNPACITKVDVQSSNRIKPGIYFGVNNHYEWEPKGVLGASEAVRLIESEFQSTLVNSNKMINTLITSK